MIRLDKFLFATRIFKTRTIATEECKKGRITIDGQEAKPSRMIDIGDIINVRKPPVTYSYRVVGLTENRVGAKLVPQYIEDITAPEQLEILQLKLLAGQQGRDRGTGRPTKKDRRDIETFLGL
ncbi:MAG: RNA-binding S4 domain-containing protein [Paludibacteraceae bacterium]|nr:RNA-binding S4 domain-containing protein [Paludibacteraceae bacterium]